MENQKSFKFYHLLIAFLVGLVASAGLLLAPSYGKQGKLVVSPIGGTCSVTTCDIYKLVKENNQKLVDLEQQVNDRGDWLFMHMNTLLNPYTGQLGTKLNDLEQKIDNKGDWLFMHINTMLNPYTGQLGTRLNNIENRLP